MQINESTGLACLNGPESVVMTCWFQDIKLTVVLSGETLHTILRRRFRKLRIAIDNLEIRNT